MAPIAEVPADASRIHLNPDRCCAPLKCAMAVQDHATVGKNIQASRPDSMYPGLCALTNLCIAA
jgi:hypothetical protein